MYFFDKELKRLEMDCLSLSLSLNRIDAE